PLDAGAVVPAAVEDHHLTGRGQMGQVALRVHLALLALAGRRQGHHAEHAWADSLGDRLDGPALARAVAALEADAQLETFVFDPLLELHQLDVQEGELFFVLLAGELFLVRRAVLSRPRVHFIGVGSRVFHGATVAVATAIPRVSGTAVA